MTERAGIEAAIAALEAQRPALGDPVVDAAVSPLYARLTALDTDPRKAEGAQQLKHVAILFVDVVGSTAMSGQLDPEDIVEVIDTALGGFTSEIHAHHGRVLQFTGDGLLAVFGADQADEQGAENAVHAGLAIIEQAARLAPGIAARHDVHGFNVRAGIDCGQVLLGGGVDAENSIRGSAVNLAARMEQSAPIGALRISHNACRQVRGIFELAEQPALQVKGVSAPVRSYLVLRARPRALRARPWSASPAARLRCGPSPWSPTPGSARAGCCMSSSAGAPGSRRASASSRPAPSPRRGSSRTACCTTCWPGGCRSPMATAPRPRARSSRPAWRRCSQTTATSQCT